MGRRLAAKYTNPSDSKGALQVLLTKADTGDAQMYKEAGYVFDKYGTHDLTGVPVEFDFTVNQVEKLADALKPEFEVAERRVAGPSPVELQLIAVPSVQEYREAVDVFARLVPYKEFRHIELPDDIGYKADASLEVVFRKFPTVVPDALGLGARYGEGEFRKQSKEYQWSSHKSRKIETEWDETSGIVTNSEKLRIDLRIAMALAEYEKTHESFRGYWDLVTSVKPQSH